MNKPLKFSSIALSSSKSNQDFKKISADSLIRFYETVTEVVR